MSYTPHSKPKLGLTRIVRGSDYSPAIALSEDNYIQVHNSEKLMVHNNPDLVSGNEYTKLVKFCLFILKILNENAVANLQKMRPYIATLIFSMIVCIQNLVKFCPFILKIWSKKPNSDVNQGL